MQRQAAKHADIYGASQMEDKVKQHIKSCRETMTKTSFSAGVPKQLFCYISLVNLPSCKKAKKKKKKESAGTLLEKRLQKLWIAACVKGSW